LTWRPVLGFSGPLLLNVTELIFREVGRFAQCQLNSTSDTVFFSHEKV